jgi:hypothetical protein
MRECVKCSKTKPYEDFPKTKYRKDGYRLECKECTAAYHREYLDKNSERLHTYRKQWKKENSSLVNASNSARRARQKPQTKEEADKIKGLHTLRTFLTDLTGVVHHVDHIVPLNGKNVCGLHVASNMRVIPKDQNLSKGNRYNGPDAW